MNLRFHNKTRYIDSKFRDAPQIEDGYGSFVNILSKVLSDGINFNTPLSIEKLEGGLIKVDFLESPQFAVESVIKIEGSGDERIDGCHRVENVIGSSVEFYIKNHEEILTLAEDLSLSTVCTAPLGFEKVFQNETSTTVCFKSKSKSYPAVLKVIDEIPPNSFGTDWAKYARIVVGEEIEETGEFVDNVKTPYHQDYPDAEKTGDGKPGSSGIHGYAKWQYRITKDAYGREYTSSLYDINRPWYIIGDDKTFYLLINSGADTSVCGFGNIDAVVGGAVAIQATDGFYPSSSYESHGDYGKKRNHWGNLNKTYRGSFLMHSINGMVRHRTLRYYSGGFYFGENNKHTPWKSSDVHFHNPANGVSMMSDLLIRDSDGFFRGKHRGLKIMYGSNQMSTGNLVGTNDMCLRVTDPYRSGGSMPLIFSREDWEDVDNK